MIISNKHLPLSSALFDFITRPFRGLGDENDRMLTVVFPHPFHVLRNILALEIVLAPVAWLGSPC